MVGIFLVRGDGNAHGQAKTQVRAAHEPRQILVGMRGGDRIQPRLRRRQPRALDGRAVQVGAIVVTDLLRAAAVRRLRGQRLDDPAHLLLGALVELVKGTPAGAVGWNLMGVDPQAVGIAVEIVSGPHAGVAGGEIQAPRADLRVRGRGRRRRPRWRVGAAGQRNGRGQRDPARG